MTRTCFDSVNVDSLPVGGDLYLGYDDGHWPDADAIAARFGGKTVVRCTVFASDDMGDCLDVERGDATPDEAPGWVARRRQAGHGGPLVYCSESAWPAVRQAFVSQGVPEPGYWVAAYPGEGAVIPAGAVAHQWGQGPGGLYDVSVVVDHLPGIDPAPAPAPAPVPVPTGGSYVRIDTSFTTDANGYCSWDVALPAGKTHLDVVSVMVDAGSPYDDGKWHTAVVNVDYQETGDTTANVARLVAHSDTPAHFFTARVFVTN